MAVDATQPVYPPQTLTPITSTWGQAVSDAVVQKFASTTDRTNKWVNPPAGSLSTIIGSGIIDVFRASEWRPLDEYSDKTIMVAIAPVTVTGGTQATAAAWDFPLPPPGMGAIITATMNFGQNPVGAFDLFHNVEGGSYPYALRQQFGTGCNAEVSNVSLPLPPGVTGSIQYRFVINAWGGQPVHVTAQSNLICTYTRMGVGTLPTREPSDVIPSSDPPEDFIVTSRTPAKTPRKPRR